MWIKVWESHRRLNFLVAVVSLWSFWSLTTRCRYCPAWRQFPVLVLQRRGVCTDVYWLREERELFLCSFILVESILEERVKVLSNKQINPLWH